MSKYYNPRIGAPTRVKVSTPKNTNPSKAKGGSKEKKVPVKPTGQGGNFSKLTSSKQKLNTNPSKAKGGKGGPPSVVAT